MKSDKTSALIAWFGALCFFLSTIEYMIPKPLPFLRLGLANLPILLSIDILPFPSFCALVLIKILGQALITGSLFSYVFVFSAVGSISSALAMILLRKAARGKTSWVGVSVAGAFTSNVAQLTLARYYVFGESAWYIAPPFIALGAITGCLLGVFANTFAEKSKWYRNARLGTLEPTKHLSESKNVDNLSRTLVRLAVGIPLFTVLFFANNVYVQAGTAATAIILVLVDKKKIHAIPTIGMTASIVAFNLLIPFGKILWRPFGLPITEGALLLGIKKALTLEGMLFLSQWALRFGFRLPGRAGTLIGEAFAILSRLTESRRRLDPKNLVSSVDSIMLGRD